MVKFWIPWLRPCGLMDLLKRRLRLRSRQPGEIRSTCSITGPGPGSLQSNPGRNLERRKAFLLLTYHGKHGFL